MKKLPSLVLVIAVVLLAVVIASPYYRLYQLKSAFEQGDYQVVADAIDFDQVKTGLNSQLHTKAADFLGSEQGQLLLLLTGDRQVASASHAIIEQAVDTVVNEQAFLQALNGNISHKMAASLLVFGVIEGHIDAPTLIKDSLLHGQEVAIANQLDGLKLSAADNAQYGYCGVSCFDLRTTLNQKPITIVLARQGWSPMHITDWRVVQVRLS